MFFRRLLRRFLWIFLFTQLIKSEFPKIVWTYWEAGDNSHIMHKMFAQHIRNKIEHDGWEVRFLNKTSALSYLEKIPGYSKELLYKIDHNIPRVQHRSDCIRCMLIAHYGGVYLDISSIMYEDMSWIKFENLRKNHEVQNKYGDEPDVLFFTNYYYGSKETYFDVKLNQTYQISPGYQIWFFAAKPQTPLLTQFCPVMIKAYLEGATTISGYRKTILKTLQQQHIETGAIKNSQYLSSLNIMQTLIQRKQRQLDAVSQQNNSPRQLAVWHYKVWHIPSQKGPLEIVFYMGLDFVDFLAIYSVEQVNKIFSIRNLRYFLKITEESRDHLSKYLPTQIPFYNIYKKIKCFYNRATLCTVYKGSVIHEYFIKGSSFEDRFHIVDANLQDRSPPRIFQADALKFELTVMFLLILCAGLAAFVLILLRRLKVQRSRIQLPLPTQLISYQTMSEKQMQKN